MGTNDATVAAKADVIILAVPSFAQKSILRSSART